MEARAGAVAAENRIRVEAGEVYASGIVEDVVTAYGLGSCVGVVFYDAKRRAGGMAHVSLPLRPREGSTAQAFATADRALPELLGRLTALGSKPKQLRVLIAGGASILDSGQYFQIGTRNYLSVKQVLWRMGLFLDTEDVGGTDWRTLQMEIGSGRVCIRTAQGTREL